MRISNVDSSKFNVDCYTANRLFPFAHVFNTRNQEEEQYVENVFGSRKAAMSYNDKQHRKLCSGKDIY